MSRPHGPAARDACISPSWLDRTQAACSQEES